MVAPALAFAGGVAVGAAVAVNALRRRLARRRPRRVLVGLEVAASQSWRILRGANGDDEKNANDKNKKTRVAVFTNHTGVCPRTGRHVVDMLHACASVDLRLVFAPEHGFRGEKQAGYSSGGAATDSITGVAVFDAYRSRGDPAALASVLEEADVDCVVLDVQDVGARFYTYVSSMYDLLVAVARLNNDFSSPSETKTKDKTARRLRKKSRRPRTRVVILDRPNPLGGTTTEGPVVVEPGFDSFVSRVSVPIRHGMTVGELALLFNKRFVASDPCNPSGRKLAKTDLRVSPMRRWRRWMAWEDTKLPWVPPSPNVPSPTSALAYVGTCLLEATNACEGRGTTTPFELIGAPWADNRLAREMNRVLGATNKEPSSSLRRGALRRRRPTAPSVDARTRRPASACVWREAHFTPLWGKEKDVKCVGAAAMFSSSEDENLGENLALSKIAFVKRALFLEGVEVLLALKKLYPTAFQWREGPVAREGVSRNGAESRVSFSSRPDTRSLSRVERAAERARVLASPTKISRNEKFSSSSSSSPPFIDLLTGSAGLRLAMDGAPDPDSRRVAVEREREKWEKQLVAFEKSRRDALLY